MGKKLARPAMLLTLLSWQILFFRFAFCADFTISPELQSLCFKSAIASLSSAKPTSRIPYVPGLYESIPTTPVTRAKNLVLRASREDMFETVTMSTQILLPSAQDGTPVFQRSRWESLFSSYLKNLDLAAGDFLELPEKKALKKASKILAKAKIGPGEALLRKQALAFLIRKKMDTPAMFQLRSGSQGWGSIEEILAAIRRDVKLLFPENSDLSQSSLRDLRALLLDPVTVKEAVPGVFLGPGHAKRVGTMYEIYFPDRNQISIEYGAMDYYPSSPVSFIDVPGAVPMVPGRGTPTLTFAALQQMRMIGIPAGGLKSAFGRVVSVRTGLELRQVPEIAQWLKENPGVPVPEKMIARHFLSTQIGRFSETVLTQSGHRVKSIHVFASSQKKLEDTVGLWNLDPATQALFLSSDPEGALVPLPVDTLIPHGFVFEMELENCVRGQCL